MTDQVSTRFSFGADFSVATIEVSHTLMFFGGSEGGGLPAGGNAGEVVTKKSDGTVEWDEQSIPWNSTNW